MPAVRSVEPTRVPPVSSYKPTSQEVAGWSAGISRLNRKYRVWPSAAGVKRVARRVH